MAPDAHPLKRLGGGRWQTRDGRFTIESQSGRWVVVDAEQTDELGLPRVRGPYESLTAAREAIDALRDAPAEASPLRHALATRRTGGRATDPAPSKGTARRVTARPRPRARDEGVAAEQVPAWLAAIRSVDRPRAMELHAALEARGVPDPGAVVAAELAGPAPAVATALVRQRLEAAVREVLGSGLRGRTPEPSAVADAVLDALDEPAAGALPGWSLVERRGGGGLARPIRR